MGARSLNRLVSRGSSAAFSEPPRRILAIDYGTRRLGLAVSDELQLTAQPLCILTRTNRRELFSTLREICRRHAVARILVGHPVHMSGDSSPMAEEAARFAARLRKETHLEVELIDERLTSWEAKQTSGEFGGPARRRRSPIDDVAAAIMLREYLNSRSAPDSSSVSAGRNHQ
jgi:putative Holliday junction resolvase